MRLDSIKIVSAVIMLYFTTTQVKSVSDTISCLPIPLQTIIKALLLLFTNIYDLERGQMCTFKTL